MIYILLNIVPIGVAAGLAMIIGLAWLRLSALKISIGGGFAAVLAIFWLAAILAGAIILAPPQGEAWTLALGSAFIIWIGFVAPVLVVTLAVLGEAWGRIASIACCWLIAMLAQAAAMQAMGLIAPPV